MRRVIFPAVLLCMPAGGVFAETAQSSGVSTLAVAGSSSTSPLVSAGGALGASADSPMTASRLLERLGEALETVPFRGRSIYLSGDQLTAVEIVHGVVDGETRERVVHLSGTPAEIVRKGDRITTLHPDASSDIRDTRSQALSAVLSMPDGWKGSGHYRLAEGGADRVAGRASRRVDILPLDQHRLGLQLWLDESTGLLLKSVILDRRGQALDIFEFVSLETGITLAAADFEPGEGVLRETPPAANRPAARRGSDWQTGWVPAGFESVPRALQSPASTVFSGSFSDGLAAFSVFVETLEGQKASEGSRQWGASVAVSRRAAAPAQDHLVTVVGEIPLETAMQVAASVHPLPR
jgi:sigma-E factor negative regulatory protein RseB